MNSPQSDQSPIRSQCYVCHRPTAHCLCDTIRCIDNQTPVLILQHPRESRHAFGTARLTHLCLNRCELWMDRHGALDQHPLLEETLRGSGLLYPHPDARVISDIPSEQRPSKLVVIDGTWSHAQAMYRQMPALQRLPHYTLPDGLTSGFRIRQQPQAHCLSTLEATYHALAALEPKTEGLDGLLVAFEQMQQRQLAAMRPGCGRAKKTGRPRASRAIPRALLEDYERLVVVYGESAMIDSTPRRRELITFRAERPATGESCFAVSQIQAITPAHVAFLGLSAKAQAQSLDAETFAKAISGFLKPNDVLAAWNQSTLDLVHSHLGTRPSNTPLRAILLKAAYHNLKRFRGSLEYILDREQACPPKLEGLDRSAQRLRNALALAELLRRRGEGLSLPPISSEPCPATA